jgi:hypothetical protein
VDPGATVWIAFDPEVVGRMPGRPRPFGGPLARVTEREVNPVIAESLVVTTSAAQTHLKSCLTKLGLEDTPTGNQRLLAAFTYLWDSR